MTKRRTTWKTFPHADKAYDYATGTLEKNWSRLHQGDCEPFPDPAHLQQLIAVHPDLKPPLPLKEAARILQQAWRAHHRGDFEKAFELGLSVERLGYVVANKAAIIHATYLETDGNRKLDQFLAAAERSEDLQIRAESSPNAWYLHALALGRYSQGISVAKALAEGLGGKIKSSLERAIALEPNHADAHIALGAYHAEVISKIGSTVGGLTYGASKDAGVEHFERALQLHPDSAIARVEYANGLVMMFGRAKMEQAVGLYEEAVACVPVDAMERLDVELAKSELAD